MISSQARSFTLMVNIPKPDDFGRMEDNYEVIETIYVAVNFITVNRMSEDIRYKNCQYTGLTRYKGLDIAKEYKLVSADGNTAYYIRSINEITRLSQYLLEAVI